MVIILLSSCLAKIDLRSYEGKVDLYGSMLFDSRPSFYLRTISEKHDNNKMITILRSECN